jgi:hypothetical protein
LVLLVLVLVLLVLVLLVLVLLVLVLVLPQVCQNSHSERVPLLPTPLPD